MDYETTSQLTFTHAFAVAPVQLASRLHGSLMDVLATAQLLAVAEREAIEALQSVLDGAAETVLGTEVVLRHRAPTVAGRPVRLDGWVQRLADGAQPAVDFIVVARDGLRTLAEIELRFAVVARAGYAQRLALLGLAAAAAPRIAQPA